MNTRFVPTSDLSFASLLIDTGELFVFFNSKELIILGTVQNVQYLYGSH